MFLSKKHKEGERIMSPEELGNRLKIIIKIIGIRRQDIAEKLGMSYIHLTRKLNGQKEFSIKEVLELQKILELDADVCGNIFFNPEYTIDDIKEQLAINAFNKKTAKKAK